MNSLLSIPLWSIQEGQINSFLYIPLMLVMILLDLKLGLLSCYQFGQLNLFSLATVAASDMTGQSTGNQLNILGVSVLVGLAVRVLIFFVVVFGGFFYLK